MSPERLNVRSMRRKLFVSHFFAALGACLAGVVFSWRCPDELSCLAALAAPVISLGAALAAVRALAARGAHAADPEKPDMAAAALVDDGRTAPAARNAFGAEGGAGLRERNAELERQNSRLLAEIAERKLLEARLAQAAGTDPLTGLPNRRAAEERLAYLASRHKRSGERFAVALCDLDRFKSVNDRFGHETGDAALRHVAGVFRAALREQDMAARWGGEEFLLIFPDTEISGGRIAAEKVRTRLNARLCRVNGHAFRLSASFGLGLYDGSDGIKAAVRAADQALYAAKSLGRNRVACAAPDDAPDTSEARWIAAPHEA